MDKFSLDKLISLLRLIAQALRLMVGIPDYQQYLNHMRDHHPEHPPMSPEQFVLRAQLARYAGNKAGKCPC